jgi:hypothetical protein
MMVFNDLRSALVKREETDAHVLRKRRGLAAVEADQILLASE